MKTRYNIQYCTPSMILKDKVFNIRIRLIKFSIKLEDNLISYVFIERDKSKFVLELMYYLSIPVQNLTHGCAKVAHCVPAV